MENNKLFKAFKIQKLKDLTVEKLQKRAKLFGSLSSALILFGVIFYVAIGGFALSINSAASLDLSLGNLAIFLVSSSTLSYGWFLFLSLMLLSVLCETVKRHILTEIRIREEVTTIIERLNRLEKQVGGK